MFKRTPWRRRRRFFRVRVRRIISQACKYGRYHPKVGKYAVFTVLRSIVQKQVSLTLG